MFDFVHKHKILMQAILGLLVLTFAVWGIESYTRARGPSDAVASVGGQSISQREFNNELERRLDRLRQLFGAGFDASSVDTPAARRALLDSLIDQRLIGVAALRSRLLVSDDVLRDVIASTAAFQEDGRFSKATYEALLRAQNPPLTPQEYESQLRFELAREQLVAAVNGTAIPSRTVAVQLARLVQEKREVSEALVPADKFLDQAKVSDAEVKAYYDSHQQEFRIPERVRAQYVVLSAAALGRDQPVTDAEVQKLYDSRAGQYQVAEQRRVSHILVAVPQNATEAQREAARKKAEEILAELRKAPKRFAELAKKYSQDPGSAQKGGDMGLISRGMTVKPFEDAAFALAKVGDLSGVVKSDYGYHIIELTGLVPARVRPLADVRAQLVAEIQKQKGAQLFDHDADSFTNMVYEQSDSLEPVAKRYKLELQTTDWIERDKAPAPLDNKRVLGALFSDDAIRNKHNTDAIDVGEDRLVAARVLEHQPASLRKYEDVKAQIEQKLRRGAAAALAAKAGEARLVQLRKGEDAGLAWGAAHDVSRSAPGGLSEDTLRLIVSADVSKLPAYVGAPAGDLGYAIYRISKVTEAPQASDAQRQADLERAERMEGATDFGSYLKSLRADTDVTINEKLLLPQQQ
ncbi:MAG TPA: SurA N-terminal domain-containing protein [Burkholderiales bacterium]|nr:SurA N-terminal domain-containing protein [Burkholderiales bacterium]